jgi:two-component system CheB/CheR fusion protein
MSNQLNNQGDSSGVARSRPPDLVVGIGASAGGLEAIQALFSKLPRQSGLAFVIILHLDNSARNLIPEILTKETGMPAQEAAEGTVLSADHIYVAPAHAIVRLSEGVLRVGEPATPEEQRRPIDAFFNSLAEDRQAGAIGVILSGSGCDGTLGLKAISDSGGMTLVQDPETARYDSMPRSGATLGAADHVLAPEAMATELLAYARHVQSLLVGEDGGVVREQISGALGTICDILEQHTEHNFKQYKTSTLVRRIGRRMQVLRIPTAAMYVQRLEKNVDEVQSLFRELLISVTCFFRDAEAFESLRRQAIGKILENRGPADPVRVWVPGCASGEEAYTLAILFHEEIEKLGQPVEVQIFATDINERALLIARQGLYPPSIAEDLTPQRLARYFINDGKRLAIVKEIHDMCLFSVHDLIRDAPFSRLDLISCRNLLIYLGPHLQQKLIPVFHYALRPGGFLFLGPSESTTTHRELFKPVDVKHRIAQRLPTGVRSPLVSARPESYRLGTPLAAGGSGPGQSDIHLLMQRIVLDEFAPKSLVVNGEGQIICTSSGIENFLGISEGIFQNNVIKLARRGLRVGLRSAFREAIEKRRTVQTDSLAIATEQGTRRVRLTVQPMPQLGEESGLYLLVFEDLGPPEGAEAGAAGRSDDRVNDLIEHLEHELRTTREDLERTIQDLEVANEELKSSNEELLSMNEELQSANEEIETSREEVQSSNDALGRTNSDLENLLTSTRIATIFLDERLNIQRFTPAVAEIYNLIPSDTGRPLSHITHRAKAMPPIPMAGLQADQAVEDEVETEDGRWYIRRTLPYRNTEGHPQGLVITFVDVTPLKAAEASIRDREIRLDLALEAGGMGTWEWDVQTGAVFWGKRMRRLLDVDPDEPVETAENFFDRVHPEDLARVRGAIQQALSGQTDYNCEFRIIRRDGTYRWVAGLGRVSRDDDGQPLRMHGVNFDITERKLAEDQVRQSEAHFRVVAESLPQLVWMAHPDGYRYWYNSRWYEYTGATLESTQGWGWQSVHDPELLPEILKRWRASFEHGEPFEMVVRLRGADGRYRSFLCRGVPLRDEKGAVVRWICTYTDIETQKQIEDELRLASRQKDEFLAMLAHELRNPLSPIRNAVHLLKIAGDDETIMAEARDMIDRQVTHLVRFVDDLMDISRITRGKIVLHKQPLDLAGVIRSAVESARPLIESRKHHLEVDLPSQPFIVEADSTRLGQVVLNLLNNSAKYTEEGGRIRLSLTQEDGNAVIRVRDNGMGIAPEILPKIFELFTQSERTLDRSQGGLGIGLTIVRRLVELHDGRVEAHSEGPGQGSEFTVVLPLAEDASADAAPERTKETSNNSHHHLRVLVIDDHQDSAESLRTVLLRMGHEVATAYESGQALQLAREFQPHVVLCDLGLPIMDGYELARRLRDLPATSRAMLVALTGYGQREHRQRALEAGFDDHLVKPVSPDTLGELLEDAWARLEGSESVTDPPG